MQVLGSSTRKNELALAACELIIDSWYCAYEENFGPPESFVTLNLSSNWLAATRCDVVHRGRWQEPRGSCPGSRSRAASPLGCLSTAISSP